MEENKNQAKHVSEEETKKVEPEPAASKKSKKKLIIISGVVLVVIIAVVMALGISGAFSKHGDHHSDEMRPSQANGGQQADAMPLADATDPVARGKYLSNGQCSGEGSKKLTHAPMDSADIGAIIPFGLMLKDHVTPVDHEYYYQKNIMAPKDTYNVYAPADGHIVSVEHHGDNNSNEERWRVVIAYSCTYLSYYDLMTDFSLQSQLPSGWGPNNNGGVNIAVKAGQVIGKVGGQSLDFAVWDTTKTLPGLLFVNAYNNAEPWKINTVQPLEYFADSVKQQILPKYVGDQSPKDGKLDYDIAGKAVGTWFLKGSNGYAGTTNPYDHDNGYKGHLSLAYDHVDTSKLTVSVGDYQGQATQFAVVGNTPDFKTVDKTSGVVKYQLASRIYKTDTGAPWNGSEFVKSVTMNPDQPQATLLVQVMDNNQIKIEFFPGKTPAQVSGFTSAAKVYNRGQDAKLLVDPGHPQ